MIYFVVLDSSGVVTRAGQCPDQESLLLQAGPGETVLESSTDIVPDGTWKWDGEQFVKQDVQPFPFEFLKVFKLAEARAKYNEKSKVWYGHSSAGVQLDDGSRAVLTAAVSMVQIAQATGSFTSFKWKMADNTEEVFSTASSFLMFAVQAGQFWQSCFWKYQDLKQELNNAATVEELDSISLDDGWPS